MVADLRVASAALSSFHPFGRWPAINPSLSIVIATPDLIRGKQSRQVQLDCRVAFGSSQ